MGATTAFRYGVLLGLVLASPGCRTAPEPDPTGPAITATTLGMVHLQEGRLPEAEVEFRKVIALIPRAGSGYGNLAQVFLRGERYQDAETEIRKAIERDSANVAFHLLLARVYQRTGRLAEARRELATRLEVSPGDARIPYALVALAQSPADSIGYLRRTVLEAPASLAPRIGLALTLARAGEADSALAELEDLQKQWAEPPAEALPAFEAARRLLRAGRPAEALQPLGRFHRILELTPAYQASLLSLGGGTGPVAGYPVLTFSPILPPPGEVRPTGVAVGFADATIASGLPEPRPGTTSLPLAIADLDGDGYDDLLIGGRLFRNAGGRFVDATVAARIPQNLAPVILAVGDYDNDGHMDAFAREMSGSRLLRGSANGTFTEAAGPSDLAAQVPVRMALFVDLDHDGDLDLLLLTAGGIRLYRNNLDSTFTDSTAPMGLAGNPGARSAVFGDLDDDGMIDLVLAGQGPVASFRNRGQSQFENLAPRSGLPQSGPSQLVAIGDCDNDGDLDLLLASQTGVGLWRNAGDGSFTEDRQSSAGLAGLRPSAVTAAAFLDYDNDGRLDLAVGSAAAPGKTLSLFHNDGPRFSDQSHLLPPGLPPSAALVVDDVDRDGDEDLVVAGSDGTVRLLRNEGGNTNPYVQVQLTALRTGSGKNNSFGIGARLELRAGDLYQSRVVTGRATHFGLGSHTAADGLRIQWPNGVQQVLSPGVSAEVREAEVLKGSCAFAYAWDGHRFQLVSDVMWKSALGMPMGIMGSNTSYGPPGASTEYIRIPGPMLAPRDGRYTLQITEELWETAYLDQVRLLVVDHPDSVEVFVNERFVPPGPTPLRLYQAVRPRPPVAAADGDGNDVLPLLVARDDRYVAGFSPSRYQGITEPHDLILDLGDLAGMDSVFLFLNGWIYPSDASINVAVAQSAAVQVQAPSLEVRNGRGQWEMVLPDLGFPAGKRKTVIADLTGRFPTANHQVRIRTTMQIYWDQAFVSATATRSPVTITPLDPVAADLHLRGFSRTFRKGGRYGPQWFDYDSVFITNPWRPITGTFTRYGDVRALLYSPDDTYVVMAPGDETTVHFDASAAPALPAGWQRDFLLYTDGWIKDSDLNTATGTAVAPLPFHSMDRYPYGTEQSYPTDQARRDYLREYQTRRIGARP